MAKTKPTSIEINRAVETYRANAKRGAVTKLARRIASDPRFLVSVSPSKAVADSERRSIDAGSVPLLEIV